MGQKATESLESRKGPVGVLMVLLGMKLGREENNQIV